jgi:hypothetical protein
VRRDTRPLTMAAMGHSRQSRPVPRSLSLSFSAIINSPLAAPILRQVACLLRILLQVIDFKVVVGDQRSRPNSNLTRARDDLIPPPSNATTDTQGKLVRSTLLTGSYALRGWPAGSLKRWFAFTNQRRKDNRMRCITVWSTLEESEMLEVDTCHMPIS